MNNIKEAALTNLFKSSERIRYLSGKNTEAWTNVDKLHAASVLCFLDAYLTMLEVEKNQTPTS